MIYTLFPLVIFAAAFLHMRSQRYEGASIALIFVAIALYYFHFYHAQWNEFAIDAEAHAAYVEYIANHGALPSVNENQATRHPPAYYLLAAVFYKIGQYQHMQDPLLMVRHVSMMCFVAFILIAANLLRLLLPKRNIGYYAALIMLVFWPIGVTMGARISCDILLYAAEAGVLYALVEWLYHRNPHSLGVAILWAGIAMLAKSSGLVVLAISLFMLALAAMQYRMQPRFLLRRDLLIALLFAGLCCLLTFWHQRGAWSPADVLSHKLSLDPMAWWHMFGSFNMFLFVFDVHMGLSHDMFWNMLLHTLMLGNGSMIWKAELITELFNVLWLTVGIYLLEGAFRFGRDLFREKQVALLLALFVFIMVFSMMVMRMRVDNVEYSDARYIYPIVAIIALCHGKVMQCHLQARRMRSYKFGAAIALAFLVMSPALFFVQYADVLH